MELNVAAQQTSIHVVPPEATVEMKTEIFNVVMSSLRQAGTEESKLDEFVRQCQSYGKCSTSSEEKLAKKAGSYSQFLATAFGAQWVGQHLPLLVQLIPKVRFNKRIL